MAVAHAQHAVSEMTSILTGIGKKVAFGIHPVAGRLPGHMNVLLAEANVPYNIVYEMDEVNPTMSENDVCLVVGANDTVNPAAENDPDSPIAGHAGDSCVGVEARGRVQAIDEPRLCRRGEPSLLLREHQHVLRRRQEHNGIHRRRAA